MNASDGTPLNRPLFDALARPANAYIRGPGRPSGPGPLTDQPAPGTILPDGTVIDTDLSGSPAARFTHQTPVRKLKAAHHELARMMALGFKDKEIHEVMGYSYGHLNTLRRSPAFQNLVLYFTTARDRETLDVKARIESLALRGLDRIAERLDDDEASAAISADVLRKITTDLLDRSGHSPVHKVAAVSIGMTVDEIKKMKEELRGRSPQASEANDPGPPLGEVGAGPVEGDEVEGDLGAEAGPEVRASVPTTLEG